MKVCMVAYSFYEKDNRVRRYAETLVKRGDQVDVLSLRSEEQPRVEFLNGVRIYRIQRRVVSEKGKFSYLAKILLFFFRSLGFLSWKHLQERYDLVHVHSIPDFEVFAAIVPKLTGAKIILDLHDLVPEFYISKFKSSSNSTMFRALVGIERMSNAFADHVIAANHIWLQRLYDRSVSREDCTVILNYPDTDIFHLRGRTRSDGRFVMVYPGSLNYHQGVDIAVRAFGKIAGRVPQAEFHIYGSGEQLDALAALIEELNLRGRVMLQGSRSLQEIAEIMENSDLGVVAKRSDCFGDEAFSTKIFEFMSEDVPVIVPNTTIDRYYFNDSVVRFFQANDDERLAEAMLEMIQNRQVREELVRNAHEFIKGYTWDKNRSVYLNLVDSLVARAGNPVTAKG
jgi:glycosyltransferase involved in cell wall biosynthesis